MAHFLVSLEGRNFWLRLDTEPSRLGFFATRLVQAVDEAEAETKAVAMLREDEALQQVLNEKSDPPMIYCETIVPVDPIRLGNVSLRGFTFYPEESEA
jgi:hypothetical protein